LIHLQLLRNCEMGLCNDQRRCACNVFTGVVISTFSLAMIIIGLVNLGTSEWDPTQPPPEVYENRCQTVVPWWHIVGGGIILVGLVGRILLSKCCDGCGHCCEDSKGGQVGGQVCKMGVTLIYDLSFLGVMAVWLVIGTVWILPIYSSVIKDKIGVEVSNAVNTVGEQLSKTGIVGVTPATPKEQSAIECNQVLFHFTAVVLSVGWICLALASAFILLCKCLYKILCCKPCKNKKEGSVHV